LQRSVVQHFEEGKGNLSGFALKGIASANNYGVYRLSREHEGEHGHARALLEMLSILTSSRLCGAFWRLGPGSQGTNVTNGHWVGATHIHGDGDWRTHEWVFKDSVGSISRSITAEKVMTYLDNAEKRRLDFGLIVDLR